MKNSIKIFGLALLSIAFAASCEKNEELAVNTRLTHRVTINAGGITRTVIDESGATPTFKWSSDDASRFAIKENSTEGTDITLTSGDSYVTMTLGATFATETAAEYKYTASLAKNRTGGGAPKIPASQTSTATSYDPDADILIAKPQTYNSVKNSLSMQFGRPVVINKMTLKGLDGGETVSSISITADKQIIGYCNAETGAWTGQGSELTVSTDQTVPSSGPTSGQITVYFVTMPVEDVTLTVSATTGSYVYSKSFTKTIDFVRDQVTKFGVSGLTKNLKSDLSGTYVLASTDGSAMAGAWASGNNIPETYSVLDGRVLYYDPDQVNIDEAKITVARIADSESPYFNMYTMSQNGKYLYAAGSGSDNFLKGKDVLDAHAYWDITETAGVWSVVASQSSNNNNLKYNSGNKLFSCYSGGQSPVALFSNFAPTPVITANDINILSVAIPSTDTGASFNSNTNTVTASAYDDAQCTIASTWLTATVSSKTVSYSATENTGAERVAYIKIIATNTSDRSVTKIISVTQSRNKVDVLNQTWTGVTGTSYTNKSDLDGSSSDAVYAVNCAGDKSSIQLRATNPSGIVSTTSGGKVRKVTVTWHNDTANDRTLDIYGKNSAYSGPADLYAAGTSGTKLGTIVKGTSTVLAITGDYEYIGLRSNGNSMYLTEIRIEWEPVTKYNVTIDDGITNGTVATNLSRATEGATVSLTATPDFGYAFDAWDVYKTGEPATKVAVTENAFTMPAYDVTVSASFVAVPTINMLKTTINSVAAAGVAGASETGVYEFLNGATDASVTVTCDGTVVTAASKNNGAVTYTVAANAGAARSGWIKVKYGSEDAHTVTVNQLAGAVRYYVKVTSTPVDWTGEYIIVYESDASTAVVFNGALATLDGGRNVVGGDESTTFAISDNKIVATDALNAATFTITANTVKSKSGKWINQTSWSNGLSSLSTSSTLHGVSIDGSGNLIVQGSGNSSGSYVQLCFNKVSGATNYRFRFYKTPGGNNAPIALYKYE